MKFFELFEQLTILEGDITPKHVFWQHDPAGSDFVKNTAAKQNVIKDLTGPIIDTGNNIWYKKVNGYEMLPSFLKDYQKGPADKQQVFKTKLEEWKAGTIPIKIDPKKHTIDGYVWDANRIKPSIKVRFDIDGKNRTLRLRNVWWTYDDYSNQFNT